MKRILSLFTVLLLCIMLLSACGANNALDSSGAGNHASESAFNLSEQGNPFLGEWQSDIPSANTTLKFNYKADGTFDYEMAGVPADTGGKGTASDSFAVKDKDTIDVTELEPDASGQLVPGNTTSFVREK